MGQENLLRMVRWMRCKAKMQYLLTLHILPFQFAKQNISALAEECSSVTCNDETLMMSESWKTPVSSWKPVDPGTQVGAWVMTTYTCYTAQYPDLAPDQIGIRIRGSSVGAALWPTWLLSWIWGLTWHWPGGYNDTGGAVREDLRSR